MEKAELTQVERLRLEACQMIETEATLKRQILLRDIMIRLNLGFDDKIQLQGTQVIFERKKDQKCLAEKPGSSTP